MLKPRHHGRRARRRRGRRRGGVLRHVRGVRVQGAGNAQGATHRKGDGGVERALRALPERRVVAAVRPTMTRANAERENA